MELSNLKKNVHQITLSGNLLEEEKFHVLGFVPIYILELKEDIWFKKIDSDHISSVELFFSSPRHSGSGQY